MHFFFEKKKKKFIIFEDELHIIKNVTKLFILKREIDYIATKEIRYIFRLKIEN